MNYDELSDRELDALVAEKVFGRSTEFNPYKEWRMQNRKGGWGSLPEFCWLICRAFEVVEAMRDKTEIDIESYAPSADYPKGYWHVNFSEPTEWTRLGESENESLPRAICIAALRALDA